jgi:hypothetical protein
MAFIFFPAFHHGERGRDSLYSGLAPGKVLLIRQDVTSKTVTILLVTDPGASGTFVSIDNSVTDSVGAIKNALYLGL